MDYFNGLVQEVHNSIANALELHLSCTNPLICSHVVEFHSNSPAFDMLCYSIVWPVYLSVQFLVFRLFQLDKYYQVGKQLQFSLYCFHVSHLKKKVFIIESPSVKMLCIFFSSDVKLKYMYSKYYLVYFLAISCKLLNTLRFHWGVIQCVNFSSFYDKAWTIRLFLVIY